ncbi:Apolipoprotein D neural lazarillo [Operophtera brumata]|uniref:Apolipoprotein D neural lazarillo n=1 Tax=Operophtera brumata TaxID=104452 RepID=A0A0L7KT27_OPEBR|nr:Apolipoprotein D neural lazarillo [Operophtera brumata]
MRLCDAQIVLPGPCPDVQAMSDFDGARYLGKWYEAEKYFFLFEFGGKSGVQSEIQGEASQVSRSDEGKLSVRFPSLPVNIAAPYWVYLGKWYEAEKYFFLFEFGGKCITANYDQKESGIWSPVRDPRRSEPGQPLGRRKAVSNAWILTRARNPQSSVLDKAYEAADKNRISRTFFMATNQQDCPDE